MTLKERIHRDPVPIELVRPSFYGMLVMYYSGIVTYGATQAAFKSPSLIAAGGDTFAFWWAAVVAMGGIVAVIGVVLTRLFDNGWIEFAATTILISMFAGFTGALLWRGLTSTDPHAISSIPIAWLPLILCVLPGWRIAVMVIDRTVIFKHAKQHAIEVHNREAEIAEGITHYK